MLKKVPLDHFEEGLARGPRMNRDRDNEESSLLDINSRSTPLKNSCPHIEVNPSGPLVRKDTVLSAIRCKLGVSAVCSDED